MATFHSNVGRERMSSLWFQLAAPMMRPVWNRLARRIAVSEAARHSVTSRMGGDDLLIVPNGVDVGRFAGAKAATLPPGRHLLFVGRLEERKGFPVAVDAFAQLAGLYPDLRLLVVGDGSERDAVDDLEPPVRSRVEMLGRVDDDQLASYLRGATLYVGPATGRGELRDGAGGGDGRRAADRGERHRRDTATWRAMASKRCWCRRATRERW